MPTNVSNLLVTFLLPAIKGVGKMELLVLLGKVKEHNTPEYYANVLKSLNGTFSVIADEAKNTKTQIDDGICGFILEAVKEAAAADNVTL